MKIAILVLALVGVACAALLTMMVLGIGALAPRDDA